MPKYQVRIPIVQIWQVEVDADSPKGAVLNAELLDDVTKVGIFLSQYHENIESEFDVTEIEE